MSTRASTNSTDISEKAHPKKNNLRNTTRLGPLVFAITKTFSIIIENNTKTSSYTKRLREQKKNVLNALLPPTISLMSFLERIRTYTELEKSSLINSIIYIDRLCAIAKITLTPLNIHRIVIGSILSSIKYNEDFHFKFGYYSQVFGISIKELNEIEFTFLRMIKYDLYVAQIDYLKYEYYFTHFQFKEE